MEIFPTTIHHETNHLNSSCSPLPSSSFTISNLTNSPASDQTSTTNTPSPANHTNNTHSWLFAKPFPNSHSILIHHSQSLDSPSLTNSAIELQDLSSSSRTSNSLLRKKRNMSTTNLQQKKFRNFSNAFGVVSSLERNGDAIRVGNVPSEIIDDNDIISLDRNGREGSIRNSIRFSFLSFGQIGLGRGKKKDSKRNSTLIPMNSTNHNKQPFSNRISGTSFSTQDDPLTIISKPPKNESDEEKQERLRLELVAKKRSDEIDKELREEANKMKHERSTEKTILLLGQSEAGKTTIVKQMRMMYAPERQEKYRSTWTNIVYLNLILALKKLVNDHSCSLQEEAEVERSRRTSAQRVSSPILNSLNPSRAVSPEQQREVNNGESSAQNGQTYSKSLLIRLRFAPLLSMEAELRRKLGTFEETPLQRQSQSNSSSPQMVKKSSSFSHESIPIKSKSTPLLLKAGWQEQSMLERESEIGETRPSTSETSLRKSITTRLTRSRNGDQAGPRRTLSNADMDKTSSRFVRQDSDQPIQKKMFCLLDASKEDVEELWRQHKSGIGGSNDQMTTCSIVDSPAYFLDNINRIASSTYVPTDDDILRARVRTVGVVEEHFTVNKQISYRIIDVGGSQSQRNVWAQFFYNATAIIFLAPISAFDETLSEDKETNKIIDSLEIWKQVLTSPLLLRISLILFLNKMDILKSKLNRGIEVKQYFKKYNGNNEFEEVWRYFRSMFLLLAREHEHKAPSRNLYVHKTTATSTQEIRSILTSCQDIILRQHLRDTALT